VTHTQTATGPDRTRWAPVVALGIGMLVVTSDISIMAVTLPGIGAEFGVGPATVAWVLLAYALPLGAMAVPAGRWADRAGVRPAFLLGLTGTAVASVLGALAPTFPLLLAARVAQGLTGGIVIAVFMPLLLRTVHATQRGRAMGSIITIMTVGGAAGVPIGGLVAGVLGWREVLLLKLPLVAVAIVTVLRSVPPGGGLPVPGRALVGEALLVGGAVTALLLGLDRVASAPGLAVALAVVAAALLVVWGRLDAARPLLALARRPEVAAMLTALFAVSATMGLMAFLVPFLVADVLGRSPEFTGVALLFLIGTIAPVSSLAGWASDRLGTRRVALAGAVVAVVGVLTMLSLPADAGLADLAWRLAVLGTGIGLFNPPLNAAILAASPPEMAGTAGGLAMTVRTLAMTGGPAVAALAWTAAGGGLAGFRAGAVTLACIAALGVAALAAPWRSPR
jgi:predicted MFS family arabinose efflux permease